GDDLLAGYREGLALARHEEKRLCFRLHIASSAAPKLHDLHWELLYDPKARIALSRSQETTFSRYSSVPLAPGTAVVERPKLLIVVAGPKDLADYELPELDRSRLRKSLEKALRPLNELVQCDFLPGPATAGRIRDRLVAGGYHGLHLQAHGMVNAETGTANLVLEGEDERASFIAEDLVSEIVEGHRDLRWITLIACHGGVRAGTDPFTGLGPALVRRGVPAVIAMRRGIRVDAANRFSEHFYLNLGRCGRIDTAANEARLQLYLAAPERLEWSTPVLFMRLRDGLLWQSEPTIRREPARSASAGERDRATADRPGSAHAQGAAAPDAARERVREVKHELAKARHRRDLGHLAAIEDSLGEPGGVGEDVLLDLLLSYRALEAWERMIDLGERLPANLHGSPLVREQLAFAHNRGGNQQEAIWLLEELLAEQGPSFETYGLLGRVYKDRYIKVSGQDRDSLAQGYLDKAIATYVRGFEADWRDAYAGINAVTLLEVKGDKASIEHQAELLPLVRFAVKHRLKSGQPAYWDHATLLELAILDGDAEAARGHLADALVSVREPWEPASTATNLQLIRD
ncbi:MAG: DUF4071 domain-containing protein, partial [bacterium]|nr:DUF4071 domain-containing protein [bacterium]